MTGCGSDDGAPSSDDQTAAAPHGDEPTVEVPEGAPPDTVTVEDIDVGDGAAPSPTSTVTVHYVGVLFDDGREFDSSWDRGQPAQFSLEQVVPGFTIGIAGDPSLGIEPMQVGGRRRIVIPPDEGYGDTPPPGLPAGATLVFVVDLLGVS